jgi:hypothetical protein
VRVATRELMPVTGPPIAMPDPDRLIHLQFRRFAGCPVCNLHLRSLIRRRDDIEAAGITEVLVFHSTADELRQYSPDVPFALVADPAKRLYAEFGVQASPKALLNPRAYGPIVRAVARSAVAIARGREKGPAAKPTGGRLGLPADFLIASDGTAIAKKYGTHVYDQWSVEELLKHASANYDRDHEYGAGT